MQDAILQALHGGDAAAALGTAREFAAAEPHNATAQRLLALALRANGDRAAALAAIDRALELAPDEPGLHLERAGLLIDERKLDEAQAALARTLGLDPNAFPAYVVQAQLALARGDLDEAERLTRTGARLAPEHPHIAALEGGLALRRGDADLALKILARASEQAPQDLQLRHMLGFAYLAKGHLAFAEQAFRALLERSPDSRPLRALIAEVVRRQGRPGDAADELAPLLDDPAAPAALRRQVGELELAAGRVERALPHLRASLQAQPQDRRAVLAMVEAWRRTDAVDEARATLDALLAEHPQQSDLWHARLLFEPFAGDSARALVERWLVAMPDHLPALESLATIHDRNGQAAQADAIAERIVQLRPGHGQAELRLVEGLLRRDPPAAVTRVQALLEQARDPGIRRGLRQLLGRALDAAGRPADALATWSALHAEVVDQRLPLPTPSAPRADWPELSAPDPAMPAQLLLWGAPGSLVERLANGFQLAGLNLLADRYGTQPPDDLFQRFASIDALTDGSADPAALVAQWRAGLPARGVASGSGADWLLFWDNALLGALRPHLPEANLMVALRDPRDMLLDWLAAGSPAPFALPSPEAGARWLAQVLEQIAELNERALFPHALVRLDDIAEDPRAVMEAIANTLGRPLPAPPPGTRLGPPRLPTGQWRRYAEPLAGAFALLAPVATRLGYPAD